MCALLLSGLGYGILTGYRKYGNKLSVSIKGEDFRYAKSDC